MTSPWSRLAASASLLVLAASLGACSSSTPPTGGPYAAQFAQARREATNDFQRKVLADGVITDSEFREVRQRYVDCLADAGITAKANADGSYEVDADVSGPAGDTEKKCSKDTIEPIEPLYYATRVNPNNEDPNLLMANCLRKAGVVGPDFTKSDWKNFVTAFAAAAGDGTGPTPDPSTLPKLPGGVAMDDPRVQACNANPLGQ